MKQQELSVLTNVIAVARRELADRDDTEIPTRLRKVARDSGKRLPPPYAKSILKEIQESEGFRASVQERWDDEGLDDPVGEAFISHPEAALQRVSEQADERTVSKLQTELGRSQQSVVALEKQLEESKRRLAEIREVHTADIADAHAAGSASRKNLESAVKALEARVVEFDVERGQLTDTIEALRTEIDALKDKLDRAASKARRRARTAQTNGVTARQPTEAPSDPVELAAWLDAVERTQRTYREARTVDAKASSTGPPLYIPDGLLPDTEPALAALITQQPDVIYIDGYNVAALLVHDFATVSARTMIVAKADRLAAASKSRVVVVFDAVGVDGSSAPPTPGLSEVRFTHTQIGRAHV
jgi:chaperonin cofactor prefoldin